MTKKIDKYQKQAELVDKAYPYLMKFTDFCFENRYAITINVNGGRFEYIVDKPEKIKANNLEDLWDWCCTKVYQLDNGKDVWKQINKVHQLALKEQREKLIEEVEEMVKNLSWVMGTNFIINGEMEKVIPRKELEEKLKILKEKK